MKYTQRDHTFAICAYKESPYLEECIQSLIAQTVKSNIIMITSTENELIHFMADKYNIPLYINKGQAGIAGDWNFAYHCAETELVTIAHQDDRYHADYVEEMLKAFNRAKYPLIFSTGYHELRNGEIVKKGMMLFVKRAMMIPMLVKPFQGVRFFKRLVISFGNPIACWSVAYVKKNLPETVFVSEFRSNLDWEEWEKLSREKGQMLFCRKKLTYHRVHEGSETSNTINNGNIRAKEDYEMFLKFWPAWFAKFLMKFYIKAQNYNEV